MLLFAGKFPRYDDLELRPGQLQDKNPPNKWQDLLHMAQVMTEWTVEMQESTN